MTKFHLQEYNPKRIKFLPYVSATAVYSDPLFQFFEIFLIKKILLCLKIEIFLNAFSVLQDISTQNDIVLPKIWNFPEYFFSFFRSIYLIKILFCLRAEICLNSIHLINSLCSFSTFLSQVKVSQNSTLKWRYII